MQVDDLKFTFYNCSQEDIDYYDSIKSNYNNYSMVCYCENEKFTAFFAGDLHYSGQARVNEKGFIKKVDILKVEHHACDITVNHDYIRTLSPTFSTVSDCESAFGNGEVKTNILSESLSIQTALGTKIFCCGREPIYYHFNEHTNYISGRYDICGIFKDTAVYTLIYLDDTYEGVSDGTYYKPFRTLREALSSAYRLVPLNIEFRPKNGTFESNEHLSIVNYNGTIKMDNITLRGYMLEIQMLW